MSTANASVGLNRIRQCTVEGGVRSTEKTKAEKLDNDGLSGGKDFYFDTSNTTCLAFVGTYVAIKAAIAAMNKACSTGGLNYSYPNPMDAINIGVATYNSLSMVQPMQGLCMAAIATATSGIVGFNIAVGVQYSIAQDSYQNTFLCGGGANSEGKADEEWTNWKPSGEWMRWNSASMLRDIPEKKLAVESTIKNWTTECNADPSSDKCAKIKNGFAEKEYREWFYGGVEMADTNNDKAKICQDVTRLPDPGEEAVLGSPYPPQRYYMRGSEPANYACGRFNYRLRKGESLDLPMQDKYKIAYECCVERSKNSVCIERTYCKTGGLVNLCPEKKNILTKHTFCQAGSSDCNLGSDVNRVSYNAVYKDNNQMICVNTNNICPYDFNLGGGSTICDSFKDGTVDDKGNFTQIYQSDITNHNCSNKSEVRNSDCSMNNKAGKCKNYCQYLNHCVVVSGYTPINESSISSPYFSTACINFVGDSKNEQSYGKKLFNKDTLVGGVQKHFTAPMAQCVRETIENVFYNRAGHSECANPNELPDQSGNCYTNDYKYKIGTQIEDQSFLYTIQDHLKSAIKLVLTISIMMHGFRMLLTGKVLEHKELIMYVVKIAVVLFFATGNAWQSFFFDGIYNASSTFSTIVMNIKTSPLEVQRDGCQFGKVSLPDGTKTVFSEYPAGKEYLAVFDTFDCKIAKYLGFGPSATIATFAKLILPALLTPVGMIGIYFAVLTMMFAFFMIVAGIRALHIFLTSAVAIILLVYISPITITASLLDKTKNIFKAWLSQLIGYSLQPIILFAYLGFFITIFETLVTGSATYSGNAPTKELVCDKICVDPNNNLTTLVKEDGFTDVKAGLNSIASGSAESINNTGDSIATSLTNTGNAFGSTDEVNIADITAKQFAIGTGATCDIEHGSRILDPMSDSVACMMNLKNENFGSIPVLEPFGIAIPVLVDFFSKSGRQKILAMTKAVFIIYILSTFLETIPGMASSLVGGEALPKHEGDTAADVKKIAGSAVGAAEGMQKRGAGAVSNAAKLPGKAVADVKDGARRFSEARDKSQNPKP